MQIIKVREDRWLPAGIIGGPALRDEPLTVAGLIRPSSNEWNIALLNRFFDDSTDFEQVASLLWEIWKARNHFIFRRVRKSPDQVIDSAFALASLQKRVHQKDLKGHSSWLSPNRSWQPPPLGTMKINLDGSFPTASHRGSIAGMARDHSGRLLGGITRSVSASSACGVRQHRPR